jgi:hypothetical protein
MPIDSRCRGDKVIQQCEYRAELHYKAMHSYKQMIIFCEISKRTLTDSKGYGRDVMHVKNFVNAHLQFPVSWYETPLW